MSRLAEEAFCVEYIREIRGKDPGIGGGKLWEMYNKKFGKDHGVGYNHFYDIVEKYNLKVRKKKRRARTTNSDHAYPTYPDLQPVMGKRYYLYTILDCTGKGSI